MPHFSPWVTSSLSKASMRTMAFTVCCFPLTQSKMSLALSGTSQITVEMVAGITRNHIELILIKKRKRNNNRGQRNMWWDSRWCGALQCRISRCPPKRTFVNNIANGFCAQCVIQWNCHKGVRVTGQLWNGPLKKQQHHESYIVYFCSFHLPQLQIELMQVAHRNEKRKSLGKEESCKKTFNKAPFINKAHFICVNLTSGLFWPKMPIYLSPALEWPLCSRADPIFSARSATLTKEFKLLNFPTCKVGLS